MKASGRPPTDWGPQTKAPREREWWRGPAGLVLLFLAFTNRWIFDLVMTAGVAVGLARLYRHVWGSGTPAWGGSLPLADDPLAAVRSRSRGLGGGVYLGLSRAGEWRLGRPERAVLVLGPPRSGKTTSVIIPGLLAHTGPAVSTSTKVDTMLATAGARSRFGQVWRFDPTGTSAACDARELRWSPVACSSSWDGALLMARAMVTGAGVGTGTTDVSHWARRAAGLLAPLLHAAALGRLGIDSVHSWVLEHELEAPARLLEAASARLAGVAVLGLVNTEARERSSIFSAAADALDAYASTAVLAAATQPNFDADAFVRSDDTIYIDAPGERQHLAAPLVCGLLAEIREATYNAHRQGELTGRVLFALDEAANIAPLAELPQIASEGGGQGLMLLAALQDLSQARGRWGPAADGFLTLFGTKLILPGVVDHQTLETVSAALGEYDRPMVSSTRTSGAGWRTETGTTRSTQRQRVLSPGEVANIPAGHGLHLDGISWELLRLTPAYRCEPWRALSSAGSER